MIDEGPGRDDFVRFWTLVAEAVVDHPSAFAAELMNEPMTIRRTASFDTWVAVGKAITSIIPDMSVAVADIGEASILPDWVIKYTGGHEFISNDAMNWITSKNNAFYAWHYGDVPQNIKNMQEISEKWNVPTFGTELGCDQFNAAKAANISHSYWHYSAYCNTGSSFGNRKAPDDTFGACILGWGSGDSSKVRLNFNTIIFRAFLYKIRFKNNSLGYLCPSRAHMLTYVLAARIKESGHYIFIICSEIA